MARANRASANIKPQQTTKGNFPEMQMQDNLFNGGADALEVSFAEFSTSAPVGV